MTTNEVAVRRAGEYPFLASLGDDMVPRTPGWDRALIRGIERMGGTGIVYPWDGIREDIPEAVVLSSDIVRRSAGCASRNCPTGTAITSGPTSAAARAACGTCGPSPSTTSTSPRVTAGPTRPPVDNGRSLDADRDAYYAGGATGWPMTSR